MKCKDIKRLIIDFKEDELSSEELSAVKEHVERCARCASLRDDLGKIRGYFKRRRRSVLSEELARRTRSACQVELSSMPLSKEKTIGRNHLRSIPKAVWVALFFLVVLTTILIFVLLEDFDLKLPLSTETVVVLTLMVQNAAMLFFAPILIRKFSSGNKSSRLGSIG